jgi:hypothetical protein
MLCIELLTGPAPIRRVLLTAPIALGAAFYRRKEGINVDKEQNGPPATQCRRPVSPSPSSVLICVTGRQRGPRNGN